MPAKPDGGFTRHDQRDMYRMGKIQEFKRNYRPLSALSFATVLCCVWEFLLLANTQGLTDGGLAGLFWTYIWTFVAFGFVILSLSEMASMAPISGGQYHWVSEFAPPSIQRQLSYLIGYMSTLSWQAGNASGAYLTGGIIQALLSENTSYAPTDFEYQWQGTLFIFAMVCVVYTANVYGASVWPRVQNALMIVHVLGFLVVIIVLWVMSPHRTAKSVFTEFTNDGGWSSMGLSLMVGQITGVYSLIGSDASAHMAEEVKDAGRYVPISIFWSYIGNGIIAVIALVSYLFAIPSVEDALNDPSFYPIIYVFREAGGIAVVNGLVIIIFILVVAANVSFNASTARQTFAFARDRGLPFSDWISHVDPKRQVPVNAIALTCAFTCLLSLINIGSSAAFNAVISLQVVALMMTYACSIGCVLYRRVFHPELLPHARWSLGKWGVPVNIIGVLWCVYSFFWSFWPNAVPVTLETFNWAVVLWSAVFALAGSMYMITGHKEYFGPVKTVRFERDASN
ncbi:putative GABA permease [Cadophora sp. MPI-SDFR-AT-0126]|nr:putative GABA permease [Leotiomycetes sp. MPI-SDFR-AT-0126]